MPWCSKNSAKRDARDGGRPMEMSGRSALTILAPSAYGRGEVVTMSNEQVLAEAIRWWADQELPGDRDAAEHASAVALRCYRAGGSVGEACRQASVFVRSWTRHPAHRPAGRQGNLRLVS